MDHHRPLPDIVIVVIDYGCTTVVVDRTVLVPDPVLLCNERFYYVVPSVEELVTYYLYHYLPLIDLLHYYYCHVLVLIASQHCTQNDIVNPAVAVVRNSNVINPVVAVEVKVVDP